MRRRGGKGARGRGGEERAHMMTVARRCSPAVQSMCTMALTNALSRCASEGSSVLRRTRVFV